MPERTCSIPECGKPLCARGWCQMHYVRWKKHGDPLARKHKHDGNRLDHTKRKVCAQCGTEFGPTQRLSHEQWARRRFCTGRCANTWRAKQQTKAPATTRREGEAWARWWEQQRRREDKAEQERDARQQRRIERATRPLPGPRQWIAGACAGCHEPLLFRRRGRWNVAEVSYCTPCNKRRWRENHIQRAKRFGVEWEHLSHKQVFAADRYICQICGRKTRGSHPDPRSATIDHIVPLARGGPHLRHNVQTAHLLCNLKKGDRAANDQLRLSV